MYKRILLAADGSPHAIRAAEQAARLAGLRPDAELTVLYVIDSTRSKSDQLRSLDLEALAEQRADRLLPIEEVLKEAGVTGRTVVLEGDPGTAIVSYAKEHKMEVVLIGSRGLNPFQEFVLGSVSHKVASRAACPVLIVK
ncbi:universal stress protein [Paenibacillus sp. J31TS4]|uniref:universal stress protein n=1 Tax=Paenibacillus sp. J31TS4 TaxID=2807195 RepID=UPI001B070415|nr:universal stress protein [Paenibacillus sp. J31TS4]GIP37655.1 universal stress protein [Paenibacillus sp. J31TS4]